MKLTYIDGLMLKKAFIGAANLLEKNKEEVNSLNVFPVPDGDTGTNMHLTIKSAINQVLKVEDTSVEKIALAASNGSLMGARGNSGVILSQLFRGFANGLKGKDTADVMDIAIAFKQSADTAYKAVMKPTEGTILTVARKAAEYGMEIARDESDIVVFLEKVIKRGNEVVNQTPDMLPVLKEAGVVDAGGKGLMFVLTGAYNAITYKETIDIDQLKVEVSVQKTAIQKTEEADIKFGYCTEFMINAGMDNYEKFRDELAEFGDSLLVVGGEDIIKVHIHTNNPGLVLEKALKIGELNDIKIDNMRYQHEHIMEESIEEIKEVKEEKEYSFIAVSMGEGINKVFRELNVDYVIPGGQTMNPSTEDILNAINKVNGKNIIIFPNNGNIILAAEQARDLSNKNVYIVPTKTIPEAISSLLAFNPELEVEENLENMTEAMKNVVTGQVTYSVRDSEINNKKISKDDIIGISRGEVVCNGNSIEDVSVELIKNIVTEDSSLITIFYGDMIEEDTANKLGELIQNEFEDIDVEIIFGGQPIYHYIFSIE